MNKGFTAFDYTSVLEARGFSVVDLLVVMLDVENIPVLTHIEDGENDLFYGDTHALRYAQGAVGERSAHVTLHQGILPMMKDEDARAVLDEWKPERIKIRAIECFRLRENISCIVAKVEATDNLIEGHNRLRMLPHIDIFPDFVPHITLAYIRHDDDRAAYWVESLTEHLVGREFDVQGIHTSL